MDNDWRECMNVDQHLCVMKIKANMSHFFSNFMLSFNVIATVLYFLGEYVVRFIFLTKDYNDTLRRFPIKGEFPQATEQSPWFEFLFVILLLHVMLHAIPVGIVNGLIFTLVILIFYVYIYFPLDLCNLRMICRGKIITVNIVIIKFYFK